MFGLRAVSALSATFALFVVSCGGGVDGSANQVEPGRALSVASSEGMAVATVRLEGDQISRGRNVFLVDFDPSTTEISAASTLMPVHGHGSVTPTLAREGDSYRISDVVFNMPGLWEVRLDLVVNERVDHLVFNADVP